MEATYKGNGVVSISEADGRKLLKDAFRESELQFEQVLKDNKLDISDSDKARNYRNHRLSDILIRS